MSANQTASLWRKASAVFDPADAPRLFGVPPGTDFPAALIHGLRERLRGKPPDRIARVEIYVNTRRMQRRLKALFDAGPPTLLPRIHLITDLAKDMRFSGIPAATPPLRQRLELTQLVAKLLGRSPHLAPRAGLYDLSDSLANLMDEMQGENVSPETIRALDVTDVSGHWQQTLAFINLVEPLFGDDVLGLEARQHLIVERLSSLWSKTPPTHPILVAGSTGSRGATARFLETVAALPQGAVVLPGVDFDTTDLAWTQLETALHAEDHPQYRFAALARRLGLPAQRIAAWTDIQPPNAPRNKLVSLSLRPAPVTDQWLVEGAKLSNIADATKAVTLIEADTPRTEAVAIALVLRDAAETGTSAALISPDRTLTRQVAAALDRWSIVPDDSAGRPLSLSAPGRILRQISRLIGQKTTAVTLLSLLKHPLVATGGDRGRHLLHTRDLELWLRRVGPAFITSETVLQWLEHHPDASAWADWLIGLLAQLSNAPTCALEEHLTRHTSLAEQICAGPEQSGSGQLWEEAAGIEAKRIVDELMLEARFGGVLPARDYADLFDSILLAGEVRDAVLGHPTIMIWGTLEARVQGAELVVLAGLNEGSWPSAPRADPWLNRILRHRAGLLLPEREIGLSAHDYQQAACASKVVMTRSMRDAEAQTVPSRWLNRLTNLLGGLGDEGEMALANMRQRGMTWLKWAEQIDKPIEPTPPANRPSPCPPVVMRPSEISITEVQRLIRDPYAVYARRVLGLRALNPLRREPDPPLRGTLYHSIFEAFLSEDLCFNPSEDIARLMEVSAQVLEQHAGWPAARRIWHSRIERIAATFIADEYKRRDVGQPSALEAEGSLHLPVVNTLLKGKIDRVDQRFDASFAIYDYKTGSIPSPKEQLHFDKQLLLSALIAERGEINGAKAKPVSEIGYIGLNARSEFQPKPLEDGEIAACLSQLEALLSAYREPSMGYTSRRAVASTAYDGDYDHLARHGEWDASSAPVTEDLV